MLHLTLTRNETSDEGTFGVIEGLPNGIILHTGELPWRENKRKISCIPCGVYRVEQYSSEKYRDVFQVKDVPGRDAILIHVGNWCGDKSKGMRSDVEGCILLGMKRGILNRQKSVISSGTAMKLFRNLVGHDEFELTIKGVVGNLY